MDLSGLRISLKVLSVLFSEYIVSGLAKTAPRDRVMYKKSAYFPNNIPSESPLLVIKCQSLCICRFRHVVPAVWNSYSLSGILAFLRFKQQADVLL